MAQSGDVRVLDVISRTHNVKSVRVEPLPGVEYAAGQFMSARCGGAQGPKRWLSFSSSPTEKSFVEFTKKLSKSDFSLAIDSLKPGDIINVEYPFGKFTLDGAGEKIAFLSGGIGITPIRSMCKYAVDAALKIDILVVYANRSLREIAFKDDLDRMQEAYSRLRVTHVLCEVSPGFQCAAGLIDGNIIKNAIPDFNERRFYLCGPPAMVEAMKTILGEELRLAREQVITENFTGY